MTSHGGNLDRVTDLIYREIKRCDEPKYQVNPTRKEEEVGFLYKAALLIASDLNLTDQNIQDTAAALCPRTALLEFVDRLSQIAESDNILIVSAGIEEIIREFLQLQCPNINLTNIIANSIRANFQDPDTPVVTPCNKRRFVESYLQSTSEAFYLVIGDEPSDADCLLLEREDPNTSIKRHGLKIGFCKSNEPEKIAKMLDEYDIVFANNQGFEALIYGLLAHIAPRNQNPLPPAT